MRAKVVESGLEHKNRSIADLSQKNSEKEVEIVEIQKQLHFVEEVFRTQLSVAQVRAEQVLAQVEKQTKPPKKRLREDWLTLGR